MIIRYFIYSVLALVTIFLMNHRFKCIDACGRSFAEPRNLSRHQDVCTTWKHHRIEQRRQVLLLSRVDPESFPDPPSCRAKRRRLEPDSEVGQDHDATGTYGPGDLEPELPTSSGSSWDPGLVAATAPGTSTLEVNLFSSEFPLIDAETSIQSGGQIQPALPVTRQFEEPPIALAGTGPEEPDTVRFVQSFML